MVHAVQGRKAVFITSNNSRMLSPMFSSHDSHPLYSRIRRPVIHSLKMPLLVKHNRSIALLPSRGGQIPCNAICTERVQQTALISELNGRQWSKHGQAP